MKSMTRSAALPHIPEIDRLEPRPAGVTGSTRRGGRSGGGLFSRNHSSRGHFVRKYGALLVVLGLAWALPAGVMACPNCKLSMDGVNGSGPAGSHPAVTGVSAENGNMAAGYAYSIYLMLGMVGLLAGGLVLFIRRQVVHLSAEPPDSEVLTR
jgi:hypothetical protein